MMKIYRHQRKSLLINTDGIGLRDSDQYRNKSVSDICLNYQIESKFYYYKSKDKPFIGLFEEVLSGEKIGT